MRQNFRFLFGLLITSLSIGSTTVLEAQQSTKPGQRAVQPAGGNRQPPVKKAAVDERLALPKAPVDDQLEPELEEVLAKWEQQSSKIKSLHGTQSRSEFNHVFCVEKISEGPFFLETPDKGRIDMLSVSIKKGAVSNKKNSEDKPYTLETGQSERWICTGDAIVMLNEVDKSYAKEEIPEEQRGKNIVHSPLPFLLGMKADEAKQRFKLMIEKDKNGKLKSNDEFVVLLAYPKMEKDKQNYRVARITLDKKKYLPVQVRLKDDSDSEIVYTFKGVVINDSDVRSRLRNMFGQEKDPYHPNLDKYTQVITPDDPIAKREKIRQMSDTVPVEKGDAKAKDDAAPKRPSSAPQAPLTRTATKPRN